MKNTQVQSMIDTLQHWRWHEIDNDSGPNSTERVYRLEEAIEALKCLKEAE